MAHESNAPAPGKGDGRDRSDAQTCRPALPNDTITRRLHEAAAACARLGYVAVPLNKDRRPILRGWPDAKAGEDAARERFEQCTAHGVALLTRGLIVIDQDRGHADGVDGVASFAVLVEAHGGDFPSEAPCVRSRRGGAHVYLAAPADVTMRSSASKIAPGVDIKAGRSLATCPPTPGYSWLSPLPPLVDLPPAPTWLVRLACPPPPPVYLPVQPIPCERYAEKVFHGELNAVAMAAKGQRNAVLFKAAARLGDLVGAGMLGADMAAQGLLVAAEACGLVRDDGRRAVEATIASGLRTGMASQSPRLGGRRHGW